jgi:hypothetical protein
MMLDELDILLHILIYGLGISDFDEIADFKRQ